MSSDSDLTRRTAVKLLGAATVGVAGAGSASAQQSDSTELTLIHDTHVGGRLGDPDEAENIETYFGLMDEVAADSANALRLGVGDDLGSSALSAEFEGKHIIDPFEAGDLSHNTFGNHDFDFGPDVLRQRVSETEGFQWVSANARNAAGDVFAGDQGAKRYDIVDIDGFSVGITGILTERAREVTSLGETNEVRNPTEALSTVVPEMRDEGAQVVIVLCHVANDVSQEIAAAVDGIDVMVGDDAAEVLGERRVNDTILSFVGDEYDHLGEITLQIGSDGVLDSNYQMYTTADAVDRLGVEPDTAVQEVANEYRSQVERTVIGRSEVPLNCRGEDLRTRETNMGNFVADTIRDRLGSDVVIQNGGGIRTGARYQPGELTDFLIEQILPFGNSLVELEVTGATLRAALENGVSDVETLEGRFPQVSGMSFSFNPGAPEGQRIISVTVDGSPLDPEATYTLGTNNFMADGGDGYDMLSDAPTVETGDTLATAVIDRIEQQSPIAPQTEGRISRVSAFQSGTTIAEYDANGDGDIDVDELGDAGQAFANGELTIEELGEVGRTFAN